MKMLKFITLKKKEIKIQGNRGLPCLGICNKTSRLFLVHCSWAWSSVVSWYSMHFQQYLLQ